MKKPAIVAERWFRTPLYGVWIAVIIFNDFDKAVEIFCKKQKLVPPVTSITPHALHFWYECGPFVIFFPSNNTTHADIGHESFHATHRILADRGDVFLVSNQEPYAYVMSWVTEQVYLTFYVAKKKVLLKK
jgi:hypothetical protein